MLDKLLYEKLCHYCEYQERCRYDVVKKCIALKIPKAETHGYIDQLERSGFLDEKRYVRGFVESKFNNKKWGAAKIKAALGAKGIKDTLYRPYLQELDQEEYYATALRLAEKKNPTIKSKSPQDHRLKLMRFLLSKGYEMTIATRITKELKL